MNSANDAFDEKGNYTSVDLSWVRSGRTSWARRLSSDPIKNDNTSLDSKNTDSGVSTDSHQENLTVIHRNCPQFPWILAKDDHQYPCNRHCCRT